jgi:hypothetical protein
VIATMVLAAALAVAGGPTAAYDSHHAWSQPVPVEAPWSCPGDLAGILYEAGFTGHSHQMAWAIVMRESKGQNLDESSPWYTGALGIWQVQTSAHSGKAWWSRDAMLDPLWQSTIVFEYMTAGGTNWVPWGLNPDGSLNTSQYGGWSSDQHWNWIMAPFQAAYAVYPCESHPPAGVS